MTNDGVQARQQETQKLSILDINHPEPESQLPVNGVRIPTPEPEPLPSSISSTPKRGEMKLADDEFSSPAFIKRARTSYGSLWEDDFELADGSVKGKGRKRTRMSKTWTVDSQEDTPNSPESVEMDGLEPQISPVSSKQTIQQSTTMDEGVQTEDLEVGASEALLEFARQSTNASHPYETPEPATENSNDIPVLDVPPVIFTGFTPIQEDQAHMQPPSSPRLQPLSSENLPLVSPLLSRSIASFAETVSQPWKQAQISREGFTPVFKAPYAEGEMQKDNRVSSINYPINGESAEHKQSIDNSFELDNSNISGLAQPHLEHQYGDWERQTDVSNHDISGPSIEEQGEGDRFIVEEHDNEYENVQAPSYPGMDESLPHYPDLDEVLSNDRHHSTRWEPVPPSIQYPELPDHGDNLDELVQSLSGPQSRSISRSMSAQSAVIDLTETDDEDEEEQEDENMSRDPRLSRTPAEREYREGSLDDGYEGESEEGEEEYDDENELNPREALSHPQPRRVSTIYQRSEKNEEEDEEADEDQEDEDQDDEDQEMVDGLQPGEEYYDDDDELDSQGNQYPPGYSEGEEAEFEDEEEESYDEDQMDELPERSAPKGEPIVIDLLSSDDEDEPVSPPIMQASSRIPLERSNHAESDDEDDSSEELNINNEHLQSDSPRSRVSEEHENEEELSISETQLQSHAARSPVLVEMKEDEAELNISESLQQAYASRPEQSGISRNEDADEYMEPVQEDDEERLSTNLVGSDNGELQNSKELTEDDDNESKPHASSKKPLSTNTVELVDEESHISLGKERAVVSSEITPSAEPFESQQQEPCPPLQVVETGSGFTAASHNAFHEREELDVETREVIELEIPQEVEMEVDEVESQAPATPRSRQDIERRNPSTPLAFSLDGADDDDDEEINRRRSLRESSYSAVRPSTMESDRPSPYRPSLFSRIFSIDGANEEPDEPIPYPTLPDDEISPPTTSANSQVLSQNFGVRFPIGGVVQLPTPDDTQPADDVLSRQSSFTSGVGVSNRDVEVVIETSGPVPQDVSPEVTDVVEEISIDDIQEPIEASRQESHDALQQHIEASQDVLDDAVEGLIDVAEVVDNVVDSIVAGTGATEEVEVKTAVEKTTIIQETIKLAIDEGVTGSRLVDAITENKIEEAAEALQAKPSPEKTLPAELIVDQPEFTADAPRRSHRRVKSTSKVGKENIQSAPVTPLKISNDAAPSSARSGQSPKVMIDQSSTQKGHDASIELALSSLDSPEKHHDLRRPPMTDLKLRLNRNLRTELEEFKSLKILRYELNNKKFNVLAIATTATPEPERVKNGPRHYLITFNITDPSVAPAGVTEVQIFRPYKEALPSIQAGDGVLLRDFQVVSLKNRGFGLKSDPGCSSWAVFKGGVEVEVRGPPVEYGDGEKNHIAQMKEWYTSLDSASVAKLRRANGDKSAGAGV